MGMEMKDDESVESEPSIVKPVDEKAGGEEITAYSTDPELGMYWIDECLLGQ